jgi:hypothetical protein
VPRGRASAAWPRSRCAGIPASLARRPSNPPHRNAISQLPHIHQHRLSAGREGREEEPACPAEPRPEYVGGQDLSELGKERHDAPGGTGLESPPIVWADRDRLTIEAHIVELQSEQLGAPATCQQEGGEERIGELGADGFTSRRLYRWQGSG